MLFLKKRTDKLHIFSFVCSAGRFCSHFASQSLGVQGASPDPNLVPIHGSACPMYHIMPGILQEHT